MTMRSKLLFRTMGSGFNPDEPPGGGGGNGLGNMRRRAEGIGGVIGSVDSDRQRNDRQSDLKLSNRECFGHEMRMQCLLHNHAVAMNLIFHRLWVSECQPYSDYAD